MACSLQETCYLRSIVRLLVAFLTVLVAAGSAEGRPRSVLSVGTPVTAPSLEAAREAVEQQVRVSPGGMRNATASTTPEAEHAPTGVRCRFWYPIVRIDSPWIDDRSASCWTARDWLSIGVELYSMAGPRNRTDAYWEPLVTARRDLPSIASALTRMWTKGSARAVQVSAAALAVTGDGVRRPYVTVILEEGGGAPGRTPQVRRSVKRITLLDGWILVVSAEGPAYYKVAIDNYVAKEFERATRSLTATGTREPSN